VHGRVSISRLERIFSLDASRDAAISSLRRHGDGQARRRVRAFVGV
jgi:hypothetical protein